MHRILAPNACHVDIQDVWTQERTSNKSQMKCLFVSWGEQLELAIAPGRRTSRPPTPIRAVEGSVPVSVSLFQSHRRTCGAQPGQWFPSCRAHVPGSHTAKKTASASRNNNCCDADVNAWLCCHYHFSINTEVSLCKGVKLLLIGRQAEPHVDPQLNRDLHTFTFVHWVLTEAKKQESPLPFKTKC